MVGTAGDGKPAEGIRASDAERDATAERLSAATGEGQLRNLESAPPIITLPSRQCRSLKGRLRQIPHQPQTRLKVEGLCHCSTLR